MPRIKVFDFVSDTDIVEKQLEEIVIDIGYIDIVIPGVIYVSPNRVDGDLHDPSYAKWFSQKIISGLQSKNIVATVELVEMDP